VATVKYSEIGTFNQSLVRALKSGSSSIDGMTQYANVGDWVHADGYDYDLSYGVMACGNTSKRLPPKYVGVKYYCIDKSMEYDMKKRVVHIYNKDDRLTTQKFYRLIHTAGRADLRDNSYSNCEEIIEIP
jgi:hypothetical protein